MNPSARRGQTETSFQWVFVLIAGIALLGLFLLLVRNCAQTGVEQQQTGSTRAAASRLASSVWEGASEQNVTLPEARVECRAGVITLENPNAQTSVDRIPIYLPPAIGGKTQLVTRRIILGKDTPAPFPIGGVAYALDSRTSYLVVEDTAGLADRLLRNLPSSSTITRITLSDLSRPEAVAAAISQGSRTAVLVMVGAEVDLTRVDVSRISSTIDVRAVALLPRETHGGTITFYSRDPTTQKLVPAGTAAYAHELFGIGMFIAADRDVARCATDAAADRARTITYVAAVRSNALASEVSDAVCGALLEQGSDLLEPISVRPGNAAFLDMLVSAEPDIIALQGNLLTRPGDCPGIG